MKREASASSNKLPYEAEGGCKQSYSGDSPVSISVPTVQARSVPTVQAREEAGCGELKLNRFQRVPVIEFTRSPGLANLVSEHIIRNPSAMRKASQCFGYRHMHRPI